MISAGGDNFIKVWDMDTREVIATLIGHKKQVYGL